MAILGGPCRDALPRNIDAAGRTGLLHLTYHRRHIHIVRRCLKVLGQCMSHIAPITARYVETGQTLSADRRRKTSDTNLRVTDMREVVVLSDLQRDTGSETAYIAAAR